MTGKLQPGRAPHVLLLGGGYIGLYTAFGLEKHLRPDEAEITLVNPENFMLYWPLLPEVASGTVEPRHVAISLRKELRRTRVISGEVSGLDHGRRVATVQPYEGSPYELPYDQVVIGLGSVTNVLPVPGLAERAVGFKSIAEAMHLRNLVLSRMEAAESTPDEEVRRRVLTFVFVGGGYTGVEALAELESMAQAARRYLPTIRREDMRWVLVEATDGILPEVDPSLGEYALRMLRQRGIEVHLETQLESAEGGTMHLSNGEQFEAETLVWVAGVSPHPLVSELGLPVDDQGRLLADMYLHVQGTSDAWTAGDCAAVPDLIGGGTCPPTAQYALRQAEHLAKNIAATLRGQPQSAFRYKSKGEFITLGRHEGAGQLLRLKLHGFPAWLLRRSYYLSIIPALNRKLRVLSDWVVGLPFYHDVVQLGSAEQPQQPLREQFEERGA